MRTLLIRTEFIRHQHTLCRRPSDEFCSLCSVFPVRWALAHSHTALHWPHREPHDAPPLSAIHTACRQTPSYMHTQTRTKLRPHTFLIYIDSACASAEGLLVLQCVRCECVAGCWMCVFFASSCFACDIDTRESWVLATRKSPFGCSVRV